MARTFGKLSVLTFGLLLLSPLSISSLPKDPTPPAEGAWLQTKAQWVIPFRDLNPHLQSAQVALLYFGSEHKFAIIYCTVYREQKQRMSISNGNPREVYKGTWEFDNGALSITYQLVEATILSEGEKLPGPMQHAAITTSKYGTLLFHGESFQRQIPLDINAQDSIYGAKETALSTPSDAVTFPPSPTVFTDSAEGVTVRNVSAQRIIHVSLGCFFTKGRMQFAIHGLLNQQVSLDPQTQINLADGPTRQQMLEECRSYYPRYRASIIVKRVMFADKTGWPPPPFIQGGWAENLRGTPLTLSTTPSGYIVLNNSKGTITDYTLGCIQISGDHVKILRTYPSDHSALEPGASIHASAWDAPAPDIVQDCVLHRKKKMAVVEVKFQDGNIWQPTTKP